MSEKCIYHEDENLETVQRKPGERLLDETVN